MKRYAINSQYNMRDLGGYITKDNGLTLSGKIIRSDCPVDIEDQDLKQLEKLNIKYVIDLRTEEEVNSKPGRYRGSNDIKLYNIPFSAGKEFPWKEEDIAHVYLGMMEETSVIQKALEIISESKGTVLFHCAVGKDRTGVISAILLKICKVPEVDVIADYQMSETYIYELVNEYRKKNPDTPGWAGRSKPEYMRDCLRLIDNKYGSFEQYLKSNSISTELVNKIRKKFVKSGYLTS